MKKNSTSQSGLFNPRAFAAFTLCCVGVLIAMVSFAAPKPPRPAPVTFGHPIISGIGGVGFRAGSACRSFKCEPSLHQRARFGVLRYQLDLAFPRRW